MSIELTPIALRATYQSASHYQEAIGILEMANKTQKKVFIGEDGEVRLASLWDRFIEAVGSIFGGVNHTNEEWITKSVKVLVDFGKNRWTDDTVITKVKNLAQQYGIEPAAESEKTEEGNPVSAEEAVEETEFGDEMAAFFEALAADPRFSHMKVHVDPQTQKVYLERSEIAKDVEKEKPSRFSLKKLLVVGLALFGGNKLWNWNQTAQPDPNAPAEYRQFANTGNVTNISYTKLPDGVPWLEVALERDDPDLVSSLLERGATSNWELLEKAAEKNSQAMFAALTQEGAIDLKTDKNGKTLLHAAALNNDFEMIDSLLDQHGMKGLINKAGPVRINETLLERATPLACAVFEGKEHNVEILLRRGADPMLKCRLDGKDYSSLELAQLVQSKLPSNSSEAQAFKHIIDMLENAKGKRQKA